MESKGAKQTQVHEACADPSEWVDSFGGRLFRYACLRVKQREVAEDLVQETFLAGMRAWPSFEGRCSVQSWLITILKNKIVDYVRQASRNEPLPGDGDSEDPTENLFSRFGMWGRILSNWAKDPSRHLEQRQFLDMFERCLHKLPERWRQAFTLRVLDHRESPEICKVLNISPSNLDVMVYRARMQLRNCVEVNWIKAG